MSDNNKLADEFISNSKNFFEDNDLDIDNKHKKIINSFYEEFKKDKNFFVKNFRDWSKQSDYNTPPQLTLENLNLITSN